MTRSRAILAATSIAAAAVLLVAGCDDDPPATPSPEPTATGSSAEASESPSPTSTAVVVAPERPKEMDDDGPAGAEAAAVYFLELDDYIMKTNDTAEWEAMSHKSCEYCAKRLDQAREIVKNDYTWASKPTIARVTRTYEQDATTGIWPIDVDVDQGAVSMTNSAGEIVYEEKPLKIHFEVEVARKDDGWVMVGVAQAGDK